MDNQRWPGADPDPDPDTVAHLRIAVRPTSRTSRWACDLIDDRDGTVFESELDFDSQMAARQAGLARLAELTPTSPGASRGARASAAPSARHLVIVSRRHDALFGLLNSLFVDSGGVEVIRDRRHAAPVSRPRTGERRSRRPQAVEQARGWWIVCRSDAASTEHFHRESA